MLTLCLMGYILWLPVLTRNNELTNSVILNINIISLCRKVTLVMSRHVGNAGVSALLFMYYDILCTISMKKQIYQYFFLLIGSFGPEMLPLVPILKVLTSV